FEVVVDHVFRNVRERDFRQQHIPLRMIARWHAEARRHRVYVTSSDSIAADAVAAIYAMRWGIELLFRELKSQLRINHMPSRNKVVVECLIYAALLMLAVGRWLRHSLQPRESNFPHRTLDHFDAPVCPRAARATTRVCQSATSPRCTPALAPA